MQALTTIQNDLKATTAMVQATAATVQATATTVQRTAAAPHQAILMSQDTDAINKEVEESGKAATVIPQETNNIADRITIELISICNPHHII